MNNHAKLSMGIVFLLIVTLCTTNHGMAEEPSIAKKLGYAAVAGAVIGGGYLLYNYFQETVNVWFRESVERGDDCSVINRYLTLGADVNTANPILGGDTALIRAATIGHIDVVKCLLDNPQIKIDLTNDFGKTALMFAAQFDRYEIVNILLERGANINAVDTYLGYTALMYSVHDGSTYAIKALLDNPKINIEHQSKDGSTALLIAIQKKNKVIIKQLLDAGADPEFVNQDGITLYNYLQETVNVWFRESVERGDDCSVINRYLTLGADVNTANPILGGDTALIRAATIGHIDVVKCLLDNPQIKIDLTNDFGKTALMFAAQFDRYEIVNILLERGANINAVDTYLGYTALMYSVHDGSTDGVKALLDNPKINIEHQSKDGSTALLIAIQKKNKVIIKQLLDAGADPESANKDGITPLRAASGIKSFNMPEALEDPFARGLPRRSNLPIKIESDAEILSLINKAIIKKHGGVNPFIEEQK